MTDIRIIEELALIESGLEIETPDGIVFFHKQIRLHNCSFNYLTDHNDVQCVIGGMSCVMADDYMRVLSDVITTQNEGWATGIQDNARFVRATPRQKCEAILRTYDKWEEDEGA